MENAKLCLGRKANRGLAPPAAEPPGLRRAALPFIPYGAYDPTVGSHTRGASAGVNGGGGFGLDEDDDEDEYLRFAGEGRRLCTCGVGVLGGGADGVGVHCAAGFVHG